MVLGNGGVTMQRAPAYVLVNVIDSGAFFRVHTHVCVCLKRDL